MKRRLVFMFLHGFNVGLWVAVWVAARHLGYQESDAYLRMGCVCLVLIFFIRQMIGPEPTIFTYLNRFEDWVWKHIKGVAAAVALLVMLAIPQPAKAQFGIPQAILLGKILAQDIAIYGATSKTAIEAAKVATTVDQQIMLAQQMAQTINTLKYQGFQSLLWQSPMLLNPDRYGMATQWVQAASGMQPAAQAYQMATVPVPIGESPAYYASASPAQQQRIAVEYADLLDTDAAGAAALQAIGDSNAAVMPAQLAVNNLVADSFASGFVDNPQLSQIALAQKQNIASGMQVQIEHQNQQLLTIIAHQLVLINKRARNEEAIKLNADAVIHEQQVQARQGAQGLAAALNSFRY